MTTPPASTQETSATIASSSSGTKPKNEKLAAVKNLEQTPGIPLHLFWLEAFVAVALIAILSVGSLVIIDEQQSNEIASRIVDMRVDAITQRLSEYLGFYQSMLRGIATDPNLLQIVNKWDNNAITAEEQVLANVIPGTLRVRLLKPEYDIPDLKADPPLSYASVALLRMAETATQSPPLDVIQVGDKLYLIGAVALRDKTGQIQGVLHLTLSAATLRSEIDHFGNTQGLVALQQQVNNQPVTILGFSGHTSPNGQHPLAASQLQLAYWYGNTGWGGMLAPGLWSILALLLTCGLIFGLQYWRLQKIVTADQATLLSMLEDLLIGRKPKVTNIELREFLTTAEAIKKLIKDVRFKTPNVFEGTTQTAFTPNNIKKGSDLAATLSQASPTVATPQNIAKDGQIQDATVKQASTPNAGSGRQLSPAATSKLLLSESIFRSYDIRGIVGQSITAEVAKELGRAIGSLLQEKKRQTISVAWDIRPSGPELGNALTAGLVASGCDVIELGVVPTPVLYFATRFLDSDAGVMISAGRFANDYNGFKILIDGELLAAPELLNLSKRITNGPLWEGIGSRRNQDIIPAYVERITDDISIARPLKVVIDCGNGCASLTAPQLLRTLGCEVVEMFCELDANYPGHTPDPSRPENLKLLQATVLSEQADIGLAFDADGDRLGVIDSRGRIIWPDRLLMALAIDVLARNPGGDIVFDVNCSRSLASQILQNGGRPVMWKSGHAPLKAKLRDTQALLAGEWGGHIIFQERWYGFDDACYVGARLLEILAVDPRNSAELFDDFPESLSTPEFTLKLQEGEQDSLIEKLQERGASLSDARIVTVDGLRAEYEDGWGLVRASSTTAALRFRFEADNEDALGRIQQIYRDLLKAVAPKLKAPF